MSQLRLGNHRQLMNTHKLFSHRGIAISATQFAKSRLAAVLVVLFGLTWGAATGRTQSYGTDVQGAEVLTRGPVHEAFAGMVTFNPEPGSGPAGAIAVPAIGTAARYLATNRGINNATRASEVVRTGGLLGP
jgi:hypothetical protein